MEYLLQKDKYYTYYSPIRHINKNTLIIYTFFCTISVVLKNIFFNYICITSMYKVCTEHSLRARIKPYSFLNLSSKNYQFFK